MPRLDKQQLTGDGCGDHGVVQNIAHSENAVFNAARIVMRALADESPK